MSLATAGARGAATTFVSQAVIVVARLGGLIVLARLVEPEVFGEVAIAAGIATIATMLVLFGLPMAVAQAPRLTEQARALLFWINTGIGLTSAAILLATAPLFAGVYDNEAVGTVLQWSAIVPLATGLQMQVRMDMVRRLRFTAVSTIEAASHIVTVVASIALAAAGHPLVAVAAQALFQPVVQGLMMLLVERWVPGRPGGWHQEVRPIARIAVNLLGVNALRNGSRYILAPLMGLSLSTGELGAYDRAQRIAVMPIGMAVTQMQRVAVPVLTRLRDEPMRMYRYMLHAQYLSSYVTATALAVIAALGPELAVVVLGDSWSTTGVVLQYLAIGTVFQTLGQSMQWLFISAGRTSTSLKLATATQPLILIGTLAGLPWGLTGVAIAYALCWTAYWPVSSIVAARSAGMPTYGLLSDAARVLATFSLPVAVAAWATTLLPFGDGATVAAGLAAAALAAAAIVGLSQRTRSDVTAVLAVLRRRPTSGG